MSPDLDVGLPTVPTGVPPVLQAVLPEATLQTEKVIDPDGAPLVELPVTVAESLQALPTVVLVGAAMIVAITGVAGVTEKHSAGPLAAV
jgi:hypothetical protein